MFKRSSAQPTVPELMKALADPTRWNIVKQMAQQDELACTTLEDTLPISKSAISYHIKILYQAAIIEVRREGKFFFYRLRSDVLTSVMREMIADLGLPIGADDAAPLTAVGNRASSAVA